MPDDDHETGDPFATQKQRVSRSGFPFQLAIEEQIERSGLKHRWSVEATEHPCGDGDKPRYIDLILAKRNLRLVVDCKRVCKRPVNPTPRAWEIVRIYGDESADQAAMSSLAMGRRAAISDCFQPEASFSRTSFSQANGSTPRSRHVPSSV